MLASQSQGLTAYYEVTTLCTLRCPHCHVSPKLRHANPKTRSYDDMLKDFLRLQQLGVSKLVISGGEPTLHPKLFEALDNATSYFKDIALISNGTNPETLNELSYFIEVWMSLDYSGSRQDAFRRHVGLWANYLVVSEKVNVRSTLMKDNLEDLKALATRVRDNGRKMTIVPYKTLKDDEYTPTSDGLQGLIRFIFQNNMAEHVVIDDCMTRMVIANHIGSEDYVGCTACRNIFRVTSEGNVTPCPFLPEVIGNLHDPQIHERLIKKHDELLQTYSQRCLDCQYRGKCGGCKATTNNHCLLKMTKTEL